MLKKTLSVLIAGLILCAILLPATAAADVGPVSVKINSNLAGKTANDVDAFIEIKSGNVVLQAIHGGPVSVSDYAGTAYFDEALVAGRTYDITYCLCAADGYELPEKLADGDLEIECGKNVSVFQKSIAVSHDRNDDGSFQDDREILIRAMVLVDGNAFQRVIGWFHDLILKIKAWSLY